MEPLGRRFMELLKRMIGGDAQALSRLISLVERESPEVPQITQALLPYLGKAYCLGITGPPGAGKSTLADRLTFLLRSQGLSVGIVAVDPSSPFSGGAVLGDRIRMQQHYLDKGVFIRSMATRGNPGGLPRTVDSVIKLLDAFGKDFILVETVGVGQTENDIMKKADSVVVVLMPEAGDAIQTLKAGLLEIADIIVVNKADREGANSLVSALMNTLQSTGKKWQVPVLPTQALQNTGVERLLQEIERHRHFLVESGLLEERRRLRRRREFLEAIEERLVSRLRELIEKDEQLLSYLNKVEKGEADPYSASREVLSSPQLIRSWLAALGEERIENEHP